MKVYLVGGAVRDQLLGRSVHERDWVVVGAEAQELVRLGYTPVGNEYTNGRSDRRDQLDVGHELPAPNLGPDDPAWLRLRGPNLWPASLPALRTTITAWMARMDDVGRTLLHALALALGQPADHFDPMVTPRPEVLVKVIRYPARDAPSEAQGVGEHRDTGLLTFVHQDDATGLQVRLGDRFVDIPRVPGAYVVNLGEMMQLLTHGYFAATVHRVVSPRRDAGGERVSVAYFFNPKLEATLEPLTLPADLAADAPGWSERGPRQSDPGELRRELAQGAPTRAS